MKKMYLANFNLTFGNNDEPLLKWLDELLIPALNSGIKRELGQKSSVFFEDVKIEEFEKDNLVLTGVIIKDTIIDIYNQYSSEKGLMDTEQHHPSAPYSVFIIFLSNHRMALIKRQSDSPDLRLFTSTLMDILKEYRKAQNVKKREMKEPLLPYAVNGIKPIKTEEDIDIALESVKKVNRLTLKLLPTNNEWTGWNGLVGDLNDRVMKKCGSKTVKLVISSPQSKEGVKAVIKATNGLVQTDLEVEYYSDTLDEEGKEQKRTGKIKDSTMSKAMEINITDDLREDTNEVYSYCKSIDDLKADTSNIVEYKEYIKRRNR